MKTDEIDKLFRNIDGDFDLEAPNEGHKARFLEKLKHNQIHRPKENSKNAFLKPLLAIAASIIICFGMFVFLQNKPEASGLASVSQEFSQTQEFFSTAISSELKKLDAQRSPENEVLVADALKQIDVLETNYERLKIDLKESGNDKRVIYAMISNFQSRIDILENVLKTIEDINQLKQSKQNQSIL
ncbi:hypothetical protein [Gelidibacter mesophilus]|uniref:hypothetical protein n=1 Tax=Gelidibacter mesophilus TaxID=169050 RepID=UPI0004201A73|nr:hypothetical protein [Gelidibacter mesophilus]